MHLYLRTFEHREAQKLQICDDNDAVNLEFISKYFQCTMRYFTGKMPYTFTAGRQIYNLLSQPQFCRVRESNLLFSCCLLQFYKGATAGVRSVCKKLAKLRLVYLELRVIFDGFKKISRGGKVAFWRQTKS